VIVRVEYDAHAAIDSMKKKFLPTDLDLYKELEVTTTELTTNHSTLKAGGGDGRTEQSAEEDTAKNEKSA